MNLAPEEEKKPNNNMYLEKHVVEGKDAKELYDKLGKINFSKAQYDFIVSLINY